ncbi:MAG: drug/metabolite transporter (DMT)-like permease [Chlamydiales bacterium]|jgi:drug/metabolite transporter (DMT)-like permease
MFQVIIMFALFASVFTVGKVTLETIPPFLLTGIRYTLAGVFLTVLGIYQKNGESTSPIPHWKLLFGVGLFGVFLTNGLEFWGLQYLSSGKTCLLYSLTPFFSIILAYLMLNEHMTLKKLTGLVIGTLGFAILILGNDITEVSDTTWRIGSISLAEFAVIFAAIATVFGWIFFKQLTKQKSYPINLANGYSFIIGGLIAFICSFIFETLPALDSLNITTTAFQIIYITIIHSIICYTLYARFLQKFSVTFMMFAGIINPIFTAIYGWIFLNEQVTKEFLICLSFVCIGLYIFYKEEKEQKEEEDVSLVN